MNLTPNMQNNLKQIKGLLDTQDGLDIKIAKERMFPSEGNWSALEA